MYRSWLLIGLVSLSGCVYGSLYDNTGTGIDGADVYAYGHCNGSGCASPSLGHETSFMHGAYVFDAYGDLHGQNDVQLVTPWDDRTTLIVWVAANGFRGETMLHQPHYQVYTDQNTGKHYSETIVAPIYLCDREKSTDSDGDGLCDEVEALYHTDPHNVDTDGDGFNDRVELFGADDFDPHYYGASPLHKDVYVYVDYYQQPIQAALDSVVQSFAAAPLDNPDGQTGINLHIALGRQIDPADQNPMLRTSNGQWSDVDAIRSKYFPKRWQRWAHYALFADRQDQSNRSGWTHFVASQDFIITLGGFNPKFGTQLQQANAFMHELGHSLGLQHGGNEGNNYKPNYLSVMNYAYNLGGLYRDGVDGVLDYSRVPVDAMTEAAIYENNGLPGDKNVLQRYKVKTKSGVVMGTAAGPTDFNANSTFDAARISVDFDGDGKYMPVNAAWADWLNLTYTAIGSIGYGVMLSAGESPSSVQARVAKGDLTPPQEPTYAEPPSRPAIPMLSPCR